VIIGIGYFYYISIVKCNYSRHVIEHLNFSTFTYYFPIDIIVNHSCTTQQGFLIAVLLSN